jgi:heptosyltransferase-2
MIHYDCRHYVGKVPCKHKRACDGCAHFDAVGESVLVIKLGAIGDLFRTTTVLPALRRRYPRAKITWLTQPECVPLLEGLPQIDRIWKTGPHSTAQVLAEKFDVVICFDKETPAVELATIARAPEKKGFGLTERGELVALNPGSQYSLELGIDDELKFRKNEKTYQQLAHEMADLPIYEAPPPYQLKLKDDEVALARHVFDAFRKKFAGRKLVGVNPGAGAVFATKKWHPQRHVEVIERLYREAGSVAVLLGGPDEKDLLEGIGRELKARKIPFARPGEAFTLRQFAAVLGQCDGLISGDTLAMHLALAQGIRTVVIFTSTSHQEIELYGIGRKIIGRAKCAPCYKSKCYQATQLCADDISTEAVFDAVTGLLELETHGQSRRRSNVQRIA